MKALSPYGISSSQQPASPRRSLDAPSVAYPSALLQFPAVYSNRMIQCPAVYSNRVVMCPAVYSNR